MVNRLSERKPGNETQQKTEGPSIYLLHRSARTPLPGLRGAMTACPNCQWGKPGSHYGQVDSLSLAHAERQTAIHSACSLRRPIWPNSARAHVLRLWQEAAAPGGKPRALRHCAKRDTEKGPRKGVKGVSFLPGGDGANTEEKKRIHCSELVPVYYA